MGLSSFGQRTCCSALYLVQDQKNLPQAQRPGGRFFFVKSIGGVNF
ncbi:hypothetical protein X474_00480 [Dethiosulfatarculus sandiegensis]|uniref:Uncharacterized protein n=1 Tax=Dethiosulfatarculus sandiegensis TaxID=1429043 RepID=A0A0D2JK92_9BACT|nr:hypothetical protein X474_00480 [Dethiosulfatarculus sandiegensis]